MILVTGGAGYVGSHYLLAERSRGAKVVVLDNLLRGHREAVLDATLVEGDVGDRKALDVLFDAHKIDAVVHFAALAYVGESVAAPEKYYQNNVGGTLTLLEAMRDHGVDKIVFSSTCATYGEPGYLPIDETHPQAPINPYGVTKLKCEQLLLEFERVYGIRHIALRYFNAAGADPEGRVGESHDPETHLIPLVLQVANGRRDSVSVFGADYDTADGTCIRDYVHVTDLASAHALALERLRSGGPSGVFNLGNEQGSSVNEVVETCRRVTGVHIKISYGPRRIGDPARLVASATRAKIDLAWRPSFPTLDEIVATAWRWERKRRY